MKRNSHLKKFEFALIAFLVLLTAALAFVMPKSDAKIADAASAMSVKILGVSITSRVNLEEIDFGFEGATISGYASFSNGTLTLEDVTVLYVSSENPVVFAQDGDLTVNCIGINVLSNSDMGSTVFSVSNGSLTLSGAGNLRIDNSPATPVFVTGGDVTFACAHLYMANSYSAVWLDAVKHAYFKAGATTQLYGGTRAISNLTGEGFYNDELDEECDMQTGSNSDSIWPTDAYVGEKFLYVYTKAELSCTNTIFDKYNPADITVTISLNGNTFMGIYGMTLGTNYTVADNVVTISKDNFTSNSIGNRTVQFTFASDDSGESVTYSLEIAINIVDTTPSTLVTLSSYAETFDADYVKLIETTVSQPAKFLSISGLTSEDYSYDRVNGRFVFSEVYVASLPNGSYTYVFMFSGGALSKSFTLTVKNSNAGYTPNNPTGNDSALATVSGVYDKFNSSSNHSPLIVQMTLNGNSLNGIKNGVNEISYRYFTRSDQTVTLSLNYLDSLAVGEYSLTFEFSDGEPQVYTLQIKDTDPLPDNQSPFVDNPVDNLNGNDSGDETNTVTPEIIDGEGDTAATLVIGIFIGVGVLSLGVWILLRVKRIV